MCINTWGLNESNGRTALCDARLAARRSVPTATAGSWKHGYECHFACREVEHALAQASHSEGNSRATSPSPVLSPNEEGAMSPSMALPPLANPPSSTKTLSTSWSWTWGKLPSHVHTRQVSWRICPICHLITILHSYCCDSHQCPLI